MYKYRLTHSYVVQDNQYETKSIGFFNTRMDCQTAIDKLILQPGFSDYPDCFIVERMKVKGARRNDIIIGLYEVYHEKVLDASESIVNYFGVFAKLELAERKVKKLKKKTKFKYAGCLDKEWKKDIEGFSIVKCVIGEIAWAEGFDSE